MNWQTIWMAIHGLIGGLKDKDRWKMSIDGKPSEAITDVHADEHGLKFQFKSGGKSHTLEAKPENTDHAVVYVDGKKQDAGRLVFTLKHQILKPLIVVMEFRRITIDGLAHTVRLDNPK